MTNDNTNSKFINDWIHRHDHEAALKDKDAQLEAWQKVFGTSQLSHAIARLEVAEESVKKLEVQAKDKDARIAAAEEKYNTLYELTSESSLEKDCKHWYAKSNKLEEELSTALEKITALEKSIVEKDERIKERDAWFDQLSKEKQEALTQLAKAKKELSEAENKKESYFHNCEVKLYAKEMNEVNAENKALREALKKHGRHIYSCAINNYWPKENPCTCGLKEALSGNKEEKESDE